jgi:hypothetical protein
MRRQALGCRRIQQNVEPMISHGSMCSKSAAKALLQVEMSGHVPNVKKANLGMVGIAIKGSDCSKCQQAPDATIDRWKW